MVQTAQDWPRHDPAADRAAAGQGTLQAKAAVGPVVIVVIRELG